MEAKNEKNKMVPVMVTKEVAGFIEDLREEDGQALKSMTDALSDLTQIVLIHKENMEHFYYERLDRSLIHLSYVNDYLNKLGITD